MKQLALVAGETALRFLFGLPRISGDLDFSLVSAAGYDLSKRMGRLEGGLRFGGFEPSLSAKSEGTVHLAWLRVENLLTETRIVNRFFLMGIRHHALPCLMSGKIRALLTRRCPRGRDWCDLLWYRSRVPAVFPDIPFLRASLAQGPEGKSMKAEDWADILVAKARDADWKALVRDAGPFLERPAERDLLRADWVIKAIRGSQ